MIDSSAAGSAGHAGSADHADHADYFAWLADAPEPDWADHPVYATMLSAGQRLQELLAMPPAARPSAELASFDPHTLTDAERIDLLTMIQQHQNWLQAIKAPVLAAIEQADSSRLQLSQDSVSLALNIPVPTAHTELRIATSLTRELPKTLSLLHAGQISGKHAQLIVETAWKLPPELLDRYEDRVLARAATQTVPLLRRSITRAALALDPAGAQERHQRARQTRAVTLTAQDDGMAQLQALLPAEDAQAIHARLTAAASLLPASDPRSMDQKRADLFLDAILTGIPDGALPEAPGRRPSIQVVVSADTLLKLDDQPADLAGYGPITAETARRLAADQSGTWRRLLTDPETGALLDISQNRYRPSQYLRDYVDARDGICCFPTCHQPGYRCHYEHIEPYLQGGPTCRCNGALACARHNNCKIATAWNYTLNNDLSFTWTTPTGHSYTSQPPQRWVRPTETSDTPPPPPAQLTPEQWWAREDADYDRLRQRLRSDLQQATDADDRAAITAAKAAASRAGQLRRCQLEHRADPNQPPF